MGEVGTAAFYGISASVMVLLLLGIPAAGFLKPYSEIMERKLFLIGLSRTKRLIARAVCLWLAFAAVTAAPFFSVLWNGIHGERRIQYSRVAYGLHGGSHVDDTHL